MGLPPVEAIGPGEAPPGRETFGSLSPEDDQAARDKASKFATWKWDEQNILEKGIEKIPNKAVRSVAQGAYDVADTVLPFGSPGEYIMQDSQAIGIPQKMSGALSWMAGNGFEQGEAEHHYRLEEAKKRAAMPGAAALAGSVMTPIPNKGGILANVLEGSATAAVEAAARQPATQQDPAQTAKQAAIAGTITGGLHGFGRVLGSGADTPATTDPKKLKGRSMEHVRDQAVDAMGISRDSTAAGTEFSGQIRYEMDQLKKSAKAHVNKPIEADDFNLVKETSTPISQSKQALDEAYQDFGKKLGKDKVTELHNTISEFEDILRRESGETFSTAAEREEILELMTEEFPDLADSTRRWKELMDASDALGAVSSDAAVNATESVSTRMQLANSLRGENYRKIRLRRADESPIPISSDGTPNAFEFRKWLTEEGHKLTENFTIKDWNDLRTRMNGRITSARNSGNTPDERAMQDMKTAVEETVNGMVARGEFTGDLKQWLDYNVGLGEFERIAKMKGSTQLNKLLGEYPVPGSLVADTIFRMDNPRQTAQALNNVRDIAKTLGEDSEALTSLRAGLLAKTFAEDSPAAVYKRVRSLTDDVPLLEELFPAEVADELKNIRVALDNIDMSSIQSNNLRDRIGPMIEDLAHWFGGRAASSTVRGTAKLTGPLSAATGAGAALSGAGPMGILAATAPVVFLEQLAKKPVRRVLDKSLQATAAGVGRHAAESETVNNAVDIVGNNVMADVLGEE